jgi:hypothetical protein
MDALTDEERQAVIIALRKILNEDPFPRSPRLEPYRSADEPRGAQGDVDG